MIKNRDTMNRKNKWKGIKLRSPDTLNAIMVIPGAYLLYVTDEEFKSMYLNKRTHYTVMCSSSQADRIETRAKLLGLI